MLRIGIRGVIRNFLETSPLAPVRSRIAVREAKRAVSALELHESNLGVKVLNIENLNAEVAVDGKDFFILGSGSSVENLSKSNFSAIAKGFSVGINAWVLHDFVPTMYAYEPVDNIATDHLHTLSYLNRPEVIAAEPRLLILKPRNSFELSQLGQIPSRLRGRTRIYGRVSPFTRDVKNLERDLYLLLLSLGHEPYGPILLDSGASVVRMAHLGVKLGFRRIIFVGVDLNTTEYFWERNPSYLEKFSIESFDSGQRGLLHETLDASKRPFSVLDMIPALGRAAKNLYGCQFLSGSPTSLLAGRLPVHSW